MEKYESRKRRSVSSRTFIMLLALVLVIGIAAGGTIAWLVSKTDTVTNTFTYGDINITLEETTGNNYKIIPGVGISKDPKVTVKGGSEDCYLFVKVEKTGNFIEGKVTYEIADGWTELESGVYYRVVAAATADTAFNVLDGDKIIVSEELTKAEINDLSEADAQPTLAFTAYAVQKDGIADVNTAWGKVPH